MALNNDRFPSIEEIKPEQGGSTTDAYNAKNRDNTDSGQVVDPSKFIYKNFPSGSGNFTLSDIDIYPFVKIDGIYYVNDGNKWEYTDGKKTASLMPITNAYLHNKTPYWAEIGRFMQSRRQVVYYKEDSEIINTGESIISNKEIKWPWNSYYIPGYGINSIAINGVGYNADYVVKEPEGLFKFNKILFNFQKEDNFNPQKYNFVNNYIEKYKWIYQDFNYEWSESNKPRSGYEKIALEYNETDKTLTILNDENSSLESVPFDASKDKCLIYYRYPKDINDKTNIFPTIKYKYDASAINTTIKATFTFCENNIALDKYEIALNNIEAKVINLTDNSRYDFHPNSFSINNIDNVYYEYNNNSYMDGININEPESEIDIIAKSFIKKYDTSIYINKQESFSFKMENYEHKVLGNVVAAWYTPNAPYPYTLNFKFYVNNFQYLLDYEDTKINDFTSILKCHKEQKYDKERIAGLYVILKTYLTYYYSLNKQYNGLFNYGKKRINYDTMLEISTGDDYLARYDWEQIFSDSNNILRSAKHEIYDNVGLKFNGPNAGGNAPVAIALLVLWGNEPIIVNDNTDTEDSSGTENDNTGGGGTSGDTDDSGTPTPTPEVTPIQ